MTRKPRKRGPSIREQIKEELARGGFVFDCGTFDDDAPAPEPEPLSQRGRPVLYHWRRIIIEICWHCSNRGPWGALTRDELAEKMQAWCRQELDAAPPSIDELKRVITLVRKRFPQC